MTDRKGLADEFATISATIMNATAQGCGSSHRVTAESPVVLSSVELLMAAALRQEPSVDEVARVIDPARWSAWDEEVRACQFWGADLNTPSPHLRRDLEDSKRKAQAIASLYRDKP